MTDTTETPDWGAIYEKWDGYEDCRIVINDLDDGCERVWGVVLPGGLYGICNVPLSPNYQWQDIVTSKHLDDVNDLKIVHRRWNRQLYYTYAEVGDKDVIHKLRQDLYEALSPLGNVDFWIAGVGYVLFEEPEGALEKLQEALGPFSHVQAALVPAANQPQY